MDRPSLLLPLPSQPPQARLPRSSWLQHRRLYDALKVHITHLPRVVLRLGISAELLLELRGVIWGAVPPGAQGTQISAEIPLQVLLGSSGTPALAWLPPCSRQTRSSLPAEGCLGRGGGGGCVLLSIPVCHQVTSQHGQATGTLCTAGLRMGNATFPRSRLKQSV